MAEPSLEELLKLENNVVTNVNKLSHARKMELRKKKRANKNRPREESSKIPIKNFHKDQIKKVARDPRFDSLCGTFNEKIFQYNYGFLDVIKAREKQELEEYLEKEVDPNKKEQIKFLLKRMKDQEREKERKSKLEAKKMEQSEKVKKKLLEGKPAHFKTKSEKKMLELVDKYEELKSKGKVQSYLKKKLKKAGKQKNIPFK